MIARIAGVAVALAAAFAVDIVHARVPLRPVAEQGADFVPRPEIARVVALGFDAAVADYYWLRAVQIAGTEGVSAETHATTLGRLVDVVTTLDPWVDHPYRFAAAWLSDSPQSVLEANRLLRRGIEHHPREWRNRFLLGFNLYFHLGENAEAADVLEQAAGLPGAPRYLLRLVARLRSQAADLDTAALFLTQLVHDTEDELARAEYQAALDEIEVERKARLLDRARERYRERFGHDIERVEDLLAGPRPVLARLPDPEPSSIPDGLRRGSRWRIDDDGRIVSNYYGRRYELTFHARDAARREAFRRALERERPSRGGRS